jgi:hypothetical protein
VTLPEPHAVHVRTAIAIAALNFLPYWLAPQSSVRYLVPLLPLAALVLARVIWRAGEPGTRALLRWAAALIVIKLVYLLAAYPYYQATYRGANYLEAAREVNALAGEFPVYADDWTASGLSVVTYLDILRLPRAPVIYPGQDWNDGFLLTEIDPAAKGRVVTSWKLGGDELFLVCRGAACDAAPPAPR